MYDVIRYDDESGTSEIATTRATEEEAKRWVVKMNALMKRMNANHTFMYREVPNGKPLCIS